MKRGEGKGGEPGAERPKEKGSKDPNDWIIWEEQLEDGQPSPWTKAFRVGGWVREAGEPCNR